MGILRDISRFFFQKTSNDFDANEAFRRNQQRYNALYALDPDVLVRHLSAFERGDICGLERVLDEFELREDKMRIGSFKMAAAVSSKPWKVQIRQGEEENPRAKLHQEHLTKFWNRIEATDAFCRNRRGGLRLLVKQMMSAQSRVYSVHDICWKVNGDGTLNATFTHVPAWCFENRTGRLRYIRNDSDTAGVEMPDGEWLVTVGEGVGIAAAVIAMAKRLSWNDWLLFSEKCGMPVILGNTNAQRDTPAWAAMSRAIRAIAPKTGLLADTGTTLSAVSMGAGGQQTYRELVDTVDRAISALYRGGDLATQSSGPDAAGVNAQAGESELMDDDGCKMIAETLRDQVEKFVIRFELGDFEPLAEIVINPPADTEDVEREMKIDNHLAGLGVKLSKKDALARYGRTEAKDENDALTPQNPATQGGLGGLANEKQGNTPLQIAKDALQIAPKKPDGQGDPKPEGALVEALSGLFERLLTEAAAEAVSQEGDDGRAGAPRTPSQKSQPSQEELANAGTSEGARKGWETRRRNGWTPEQLEANKATVDSLIADIGKRGPNNSKAWKNEPKYLGEVSQTLADEIHAANPDMKVTAGTMQTIDQDQLNHALEDHGVGKETRPNQIPITKEDLKRIPDVLADYDDIRRGLGKADGKQQEGVVFCKKYDDGTVCCVEIDWFRRKDNRRELKFQTMWKEKPEEDTQK